MIDKPRKFYETLGTEQHVDAPFGGTVKDVHASCRDEIERLREQIKTVNLEWRDLIDQTQEKAFAEIERLRGLMKAFVYQWEQDEIGKGNGTDYFNAVHAMRMELKNDR